MVEYILHQMNYCKTCFIYFLFIQCRVPAKWNLWKKFPQQTELSGILHCIRILFAGGSSGVLNIKYRPTRWAVSSTYMKRQLTSNMPIKQEWYYQSHGDTPMDCFLAHGSLSPSYTKLWNNTNRFITSLHANRTLLPPCVQLQNSSSVVPQATLSMVQRCVRTHH